MRPLAFCAALAMTTVPAAAQMDINAMQMAGGIAEIIKGAATCGYAVDQGALADYYKAKGLTTPEILSYINNVVAAAKYSPPMTTSGCTLARSTAEAIGVLQQ